jgi:hypothetical protein
MFVDKNQNSNQGYGMKDRLLDFFSDTKNIRLIGGVVLLLIVFGLISIYLAVEANKKKIKMPAPQATAPQEQLPTLGKLGDNGQTGDGQTKIKAETLFFGNFYHPRSDQVEVKAKGLALPTNIKQVASNYYPVDREISLVNAFADLNKNGLAVIDNPWAKEANDFYSVYTLLNRKNLPYLVTDDFLLYYYQNALKNIFKTIEADVFYKEFWEINKQMFATADKSYRERYAKVGLLNDPVLEGLRAEAVYFATMLEILKPRPKQILAATKSSVQPKEYFQNFFSDAEAKYYSFTAPDYLASTINKEMILINRGIRNEKAVRSPALLYTRDYREFAIPKEYLSNSRLNNFYLATIWANSLFPLYYKNTACPDCLLDYEDWVINQAAAHLIARDFNANQDLKNRWAKIHKVIAFMGNLRQELTYLDYQRSFLDLFGDPNSEAARKWASAGPTAGPAPFKTIADVFDVANAGRDQELKALGDKIAGNTFDIYKGGLDRQTADGKKYSGMRMLAVAFDPTKYVYDQLLYDKVGPYINYNYKVKDLQNITTCVGAGRITSRCRAFGLDIINAVFDEPIKNDYFKINTNYQNYGNQAPLIRQHFNGFDALGWNNNLYWASVDLSRQMLNNHRVANFPYTQTPAWTDVDLNAALGAVLNSRLPVDRWSLAIKKDTAIETEASIVKYNYVSANLKLVNELLAKTQMVFDVFVGLDLVQSNNSEFEQILSDLNNTKAIVVKELKGEDFYFKDWTFLNEFTGRYYLNSVANKQITLSWPVPDSQQTKGLEQSIAGVKLLLVAEHHQGRDLIVVGPVFNYKETID